MKITHIAVKNYKSIKKADLPISDFVCIVGENNSGKSTLIQAFLLFIKGTKLSPSDFHNKDEDILITAKIAGITDEVLEKLDPKHRIEISPYISSSEISLARRYSTDGTSKFRLIAKIPIIEKYRSEVYNREIKDNKDDLSSFFKREYPEILDLHPQLELPKTQVACKRLIDEHCLTLSANELFLSDIPLSTGIDNSIIALLPEPIYIPAVKDFSDDLKSKDSASFGKLLSILLDVIEEDLSDASDTFNIIRKKLNKYIDDDGKSTDERLERVRKIEETIQKNLQETFHNVSIELEIPPPQIKSILSNATMIADDGVRGPIENKGDGFKRAITFSVLRTYVQLSQSLDWRNPKAKDVSTREKFLFLFEEPELYLHPKAQNILFEALSLISESHQVIVTSHSPLFFSPKKTQTFIKIAKKENRKPEKPVAQCFPIDLTNIPEKDKFQLISFETNNLAFFSRRIVLVEGDSEVIVFPHIANLINPLWDFKSTSTNLVKINGKGSFKRYREFFNRFGVPVAVVADLDILIENFEKTNPSKKSYSLRTELLAMIDKIIADDNLLEKPTVRLLKEELQRDRIKDLCERLIYAREKDDIQGQIDLIKEIFIFEHTKPRMQVLSDSSRIEVLNKKRELLKELRKNGIFILENGDIESYYPDEIIGKDKPSLAQSLCAKITTKEEAKNLCKSWIDNGNEVNEFDLIFGGIFSDEEYQEEKPV
jgi:putative ATP-dependent endonuclease of OLD family